MNQDPKEILSAVRRQFFCGLVYSGVLSLAVTLLYLVGPLYMLQVLDRVVSSRSIDTLVSLTVIALAAFVVYGLLDFFRGRTHHILGNSIATRLNMPVLHASIADTAQGGLTGISQSARDLNKIRNFVAGNSIITTLELFWSPVFLVVLYFLHPIFFLIGVGVAAVMVGLGLLSSLTTRNQLRAAEGAAADVYGKMEGARPNAEVIEAMGMLRPVASRWDASHQRMTALLDGASNIGKAFSSASSAVRMSVRVIVLGSGAVLVINGEATAGVMIAASIMTGRFVSPYAGVVDSWHQWVFAATAYKRLRTALLAQNTVSRDMQLPRPAGRLVVENLTYVPGGSNKPVLQNVSFDLEPGEVLGVIGPAAAGKSTLARHIVGVLKPTGGGVYLDQHSTYLWERENFGSYVGYLPQNASILEGTARQNIARMADADPHLVVEAARKAGIHDMIGRLPHGYETQVGDSGYGLSGGQRQRLALARALYGNPVLLVLDEPNAGLDSDGELALDQAIRQAKAEGTSIVIIAHRPSAVAHADKLIILRNGVVEMFGEKNEVLENSSVTVHTGTDVASHTGNRPRLVVEND